MKSAFSRRVWRLQSARPSYRCNKVLFRLGSGSARGLQSRFSTSFQAKREILLNLSGLNFRHSTVFHSTRLLSKCPFYRLCHPRERVSVLQREAVPSRRLSRSCNRDFDGTDRYETARNVWHINFQIS